MGWSREQRDARREEEEINMLHRELQQSKRDAQGTAKNLRNWDAFKEVAITG